MHFILDSKYAVLCISERLVYTLFTRQRHYGRFDQTFILQYDDIITALNEHYGLHLEN